MSPPSNWDVWRLCDDFLHSQSLVNWKVTRDTATHYQAECNGWALDRTISYGAVDVSLYKGNVLKLQIKLKPFRSSPQLLFQVYDAHDSLLAAYKIKLDNKRLTSNGQFSTSEKNAIIELLPPFMK